MSWYKQRALAAEAKVARMNAELEQLREGLANRKTIIDDQILFDPDATIPNTELSNLINKVNDFLAHVLEDVDVQTAESEYNMLMQRLQSAPQNI